MNINLEILKKISKETSELQIDGFYLVGIIDGRWNNFGKLEDVISSKNFLDLQISKRRNDYIRSYYQNQDE